MQTRGEKRLVRRLMAAKRLRYTDALAELRELPADQSWKAYVEKCEELAQKRR